MDILLVNPGAIDKAFKSEHLGIAGLKSWLRQNGMDADILDCTLEKLSPQETVQFILKYNPAILGLSLIDASKFTGLEIIKKTRLSGFTGKIVVGGYFPTFAAYELLRDFPEIDFVVRGEGEITLGELCERILGKSKKALSEIDGLSYREGGQIFENPPRALIADLDILPPVDRKYTQAVIDLSSSIRISASRGCWGQCAFCDIINLYQSSPGKRWRRRSVKHLVDEIESLVKTFDEQYFIFNDDQFLAKGKAALRYVREFANELLRRNLKIKFELMCRADAVDKEAMIILKKAGLQRVFLGVESFNAAQLKRFNKGITVYRNLKSLIILYRLEIDVIVSVILADAYTTLTELLEHFYLLYRLRKRYFNTDYSELSINEQTDVYRGSAIYREYKTKGILTTDHYLLGYEYPLNFWTKLRLILYGLEKQIIKTLSPKVTLMLRRN